MGDLVNIKWNTNRIFNCNYQYLLSLVWHKSKNEWYPLRISYFKISLFTTDLEWDTQFYPPLFYIHDLGSHVVLSFY